MESVEEKPVDLIEEQPDSDEALIKETFIVKDDDSMRKDITQYEETLKDTSHEQTPLKDPNLAALLRQLHITTEDLSEAQVNLPTLCVLLDQHPLGKVWYWFISVSWMRTFLLTPMLSFQEIKSVKIFPSLDFEDVQYAPAPSSTTTSFVLTSALLFDSQYALRKASALKSFQETIQLLIDGTWGLFASSLIVNAVVNLFLYPEAYDQQSKLFYLLSLPLTVGDYLRNALPNPVVWVPLIGIPLVLGLISASRAAYRVPLQDLNHEKQIQMLIQQLKLHEHGFWRDLAGWLVNVTLPNALPLAGICTLVPQVQIQRALERITFALIWDGRLSPQERSTLFHKLRIFIHHSRYLTRLQTVGVLGEVIAGVTVSQLHILQKAGVEEETLKTMLFIKIEAFRELRYLANNYYLNKEKRQGPLSPLPLYLRANYELWHLGYSQHHILHPVFLSYQGGRLVLSIFLYISVGSSLFTIFHCLVQGKKWTFIGELGEYVCNVCADWPIFYQYVSDIESCFQGFSEIPRSLEQWNKFIDEFDLSQVSTCDLSNQDILKNRTSFYNLLKRLKQKLTNLKVFNFLPTINGDFEDIAYFLKNSSVTHFFYGDNTVKESNANQHLLNAMAGELYSMKLDYMYFSCGSSRVTLNITLFALMLPDTRIKHLTLDCFQILGFKSLADNLPNTLVEELILPMGRVLPIENEDCLSLGNQLPYSHVQSLTITSDDPTLDPGNNCLTALAHGMINMTKPFNLTIVVDDCQYTQIDILQGFVNELSKQAFLIFNVLSLITGFCTTTESTILNFGKLIPGGVLTELSLDITLTNASTSMAKQLINFLSHSNITHLSLNFPTPVGSKEVITYFAPFIPELKYLRELSLPGVGYEGIKALSQYINQTSISTLNTGKLFAEGIADYGLTTLAEKLAETNITELDLSYSGISSLGLIALSKALPKTQIKILDLSYNLIDEDGVSALANVLRQSRLTSINLIENGWTDDNDSGFKALVMNLNGSSVQMLDLTWTLVTDNVTLALASVLAKKDTLPELWISKVITHKRSQLIPGTNLTEIYFGLNPFTITGIQAICEILPYTKVSYYSVLLSLKQNDVFNGNETSLLWCGVFTSSASKLESVWPILIVVRFSQAVWELFTTPATRYLPESMFSQEYYEIFKTKEQSQVMNTSYNFLICVYNNPETQLQVFDTNIPEEKLIDYHCTSFFYDDLLALYQTFLQSAGQAALLSTFPKITTRILHHYGGYDKSTAETISKELQIFFVIAFSNSKFSIATGYLASLLTRKLTNSPYMIAGVTVGASMITTLCETALTQDVSIAWLGLQIGVSLIGAAVGSWGMQQVSKAGQWGIQKVKVATAHLPRLSFW